MTQDNPHNEMPKDTVEAFKAKLWELGLTAKDIDVDAFADTLIANTLKQAAEEIGRLDINVFIPHDGHVYIKKADAQKVLLGEDNK